MMFCRSLLVSGAFVLSITGCAMDVEEVWEEVAENDVASREQAVVNGGLVNKNTHHVAIWHWVVNRSNGTPGWFPRPCSGIILRRASNYTTILTARHCATQDGGIDSPLVPVNSDGTLRLLVTTALDPGTLDETEVPTGVAVTSIWDQLDSASMPVGDAAHDMVIVRAGASLPVIGASEVPLAIRRSSLSGVWTEVGFGYGRNQLGATTEQELDDFWVGGAGRLRTYTPGYTILDEFSYAAGYEGNVLASGSYEYSNPAGAALTSGDSGGGSFSRFPTTGAQLWWIVNGVHSRGTFSPGENAAVGAGSDFIQNALGYLFISPAVQPEYRFVTSRASDAAIGWRSTDTSLTNLQTQFAYHSTTGQLKPYSYGGALGLCVQDVGSAVNVRLRACSSSSAQKWTMTAGNEIKNQGTSRCLYKGSNGTVLAYTCGTGSQSLFVWRAQ